MQTFIARSWRSILLTITGLIIGMWLSSGVSYGGQGHSSEHMPWRIETLLRRMSVEEKAGQVVMGYFNGPSLDEHLVEMIGDYRLGGVILYGISGNIEHTNQVADLVFDIQRQARQSGTIPLLVSIDQEGGLVNRINQGITVFPGNMALGAVDDVLLSRETARVLARELRVLGINVNFAPVVDVNSEPTNPIIGIRSFGSDPELVARLGREMIESYRAEQVVATAKHFPGHGDTDIDSHYGLPLVDRPRESLESTELFPFRVMIEAGIPMIMTAHIEVPALESAGNLPATLSEEILQGLLRDEMGFEGVVVADSLGMGALDERYGIVETALLAFEAGCDILLFGADRNHEPSEQREVIHALVSAVEGGRISEHRLDEAVRRILGLKLETGILKDPYPRFREFDRLASPEHLAVARESALRSITLVRNEHDLLPLSGDIATVPILWPEEFRGALEILQDNCSILRPYLFPLEVPDELAKPVIQNITTHPVIVIAGYDLHRRPAWRDMIASLPPEKVVLIALRSPYDLLHAPDVAGYVLTYGDRPVSLEALGRLLTGELGPRGKLPVDLPGFYPRGWGMSYLSQER